jgi:hypothetical protein
MFNPCPKPEKRKKKKPLFDSKQSFEMLANRGIYSCELMLDEEKCTGSLFPTNAHRHKRRWYLGKGNLIKEFNQIVFACQYCHGIIEQDKHLTAELFNKLRGEE